MALVERMRWTRRELLGAMAGALAGATLLGAGDANAAGRGRGGAAHGGAPFPDLAPGTRLGPCTLVRVQPLERGGAPVVLRDPHGRDFVVEVHRHDPRAPGVARAGSLAVYVRNGGDGATRTDETHGLGAMALAARLEARERAGGRVPRLASIVERWAFDPPRRRAR
jgi:hypothetical protein